MKVMGSLKPMLAVSGAISISHVGFVPPCAGAGDERTKSEGLVPPLSATFTSPVLRLTSRLAVNSFPVAKGVK